MFTMINHEERTEITTETLEELAARFEGAENCTTPAELEKFLHDTLDIDATVYERTWEQLTPKKVEKIMNEKGWTKWPGGFWASTEEQEEGTKVIDIQVAPERNGNFVAVKQSSRVTLNTVLDLEGLLELLA